jgi:uncharacterized protein YdhG (YjbR/CyaY superfamily)
LEKLKFTTVDEYLEHLPAAVKKSMQELRKTIQQAVPEAQEVISYNMPAFKFHGIVAYFAAHTNHIGLYPGRTNVELTFRKELAGYETSKGTIRFPIGQPLPLQLIRKIIETRARENFEKAKAKKKR